MRLMIGEAFTLTTTHGKNSALHICQFAGVVAEIEFCQITMQMFFGAMLVNAAHSSFENREKSFNRIGVNVTSHIFTARMGYGFMRGKFLANVRVILAFIGEQ